MVDYPRSLRLILLLAVSALSGCLAPGKPLVADRSVVDAANLPKDDGGVRVYTVRKGDTLYSIAWRFGMDYQGLARANGIRAPYVIGVGRPLRITTQLPAGNRVVRPAASAKPSAKPSANKGMWRWPLTVPPMAHFSATNPGVDYGLGDFESLQARSAAAGEVVYAGSGLGGYERLIIIKHSPSLLSAYGFDGRIVTREGETVKAGGIIADIRNRGRKKSSLHFELRRDGDPMNPRLLIR